MISRAATRGRAKKREMIAKIGGRVGTRTQDLQIKSPLLYQLSYAPEPGFSPCEGLLRNWRRTINTASDETVKAGDRSPALGQSSLATGRTGPPPVTARKGARNRRDASADAGGEGRCRCRRASPHISFILSVTTLLQAPSGVLVITGSEPPPMSTATVFSAAAVSSVPSEPATSLLISPTMRF